MPICIQCLGIVSDVYFHCAVLHIVLINLINLIQAQLTKAESTRTVLPNATAKIFWSKTSTEALNLVIVTPF